MAGILSHPVHLVAAVDARRHPRRAALCYRDTVKTQKPDTVQEGVGQGGQMQGFRLWVTYTVSAGRTDEGDGDSRIVSMAEVGCGATAKSVLQLQSGEDELNTKKKKKE